MSKYNGWTNYATWRVNLQIFNDLNLEALGYDREEWMELIPYERAQALETYVNGLFDQLFNQLGDPDLMRSYADAFLQQVDYYEIAKHITEQHEEQA